MADAVIGEISPTVTTDFQPHTFTYVVRPILREGNSGFDRLEIATATRVERLLSVKVDDAEVGEEFLRDIQDDRIVVGFDKLVGSEDTEKRIEVVFEVPVLRFGQKFTASFSPATIPTSASKWKRAMPPCVSVPIPCP